MPEGIAPFERLKASYSPQGYSRVEWDLNPLFTDPGPYYFTLQGSNHPVETADFYDIGIPAVNTYFLRDDETRLYGKEMDWFYRVKLQTKHRTYYSPSITLDTSVDYRTWRIVREVLRKETLRFSKFAGVPDAYLLKRKRFGPKCTRCADPLLDEPIDGKCPVCLGTGKVNGYFSAVPLLVEFPVSNEIEKINVDYAGMTSQGTTQNCRVIGDPVVSQDVIWDKGSGRRYIVHETTEVVTIRNYNIISAINIRLAPYSDVVYTIPEEGT